MYARTKPKKKPKTVSTLPIPEYLTVLDIPLFIINIANVKSYKNLEEDAIKVCNEEGFKLKDTHRLALSRMNSGFKYEPVFVFEK